MNDINTKDNLLLLPANKRKNPIMKINTGEVKFQINFEGYGVLCYKMPLYSSYLYR